MESLIVGVFLIALIAAGSIKDYRFHKKVDAVVMEIKQETRIHKTVDAVHQANPVTKLQ